MHPLVAALFSAWEWRPLLIFVLLAFGVFYTRGWWTLRQKRSRLATKGRLASYLGGLAALALSLLSPIDWLGGQLFFMHMIQHLLSIMVAAPLLWLGNPFPIALWGVPKRARRPLSALFTTRSIFRRSLTAITKPGISWLLFVVILLGWHEPSAYNLALRRGWVHDIEHIMFFGAAMLYWWHVTGAAPHLHPRMPIWMSMGFLLATIPPNMLTGVMIAFSETVVYTYYESIPRVWGVSVMQDQQLGGAIMWIPGSMMYLVAALVVMAIGLSRAEDKEPVVVTQWNSEESMIAPGLEHRVIQNKWRRLQKPTAADEAPEAHNAT